VLVCHEDLVVERERRTQLRKKVGVKGALRKLKADIVLIQESKLSSVDGATIRGVWKVNRCGLISVDAQGTAGGLISMWCSKSVVMENSWNGKSTFKEELQDDKSSSLIVFYLRLYMSLSLFD
jgi:hypothetical protein